MNFARILTITGRIIAQFRRDHRSLGLVFVAPLLIMSIFGYVFRSQENLLVRVALVNEDVPAAGQTTLTTPIIASLKANSDLTITEMTRAEATEAVRKGTERVAVVFGPNFSASLSANHNADLDLIVEGSNPAQAGSALGTVGQAIVASAPAILKSVLPPPMNTLAPDALPINIKTTRLYGSADIKPLDFFAPMFIATIGFFLVFLLTSVSFLRERSQGTMERLAASPVTRIELVLGYMLGFGFFSFLQSIVLLTFTIYALQVQYAGNILSIFVINLALVLGAVNLGIFLSAFARNELQAVQFIPIVLVPQVFLSGLLWPLQDMPGWLQVVAHALPLTYAIEALTDIMIRGHSLFDNWLPLLFLLAFAALLAVVAAGTVKREVA